MKRLKLFGSHLSPRERRVYGAVAIFYAVTAAMVTWPVYAVFSRARPLVLGIPFSLFYLACLVVASFVVLLALYRWESRHGKDED